MANHGDRQRFEEDESLFFSGWLDFFTMAIPVMHLEQAFGGDFSGTDFDAALVDSVKEIERLIDSQAGK